jgi:hypothetical protein
VNERTEDELLNLIQWLGPGTAFMSAKTNDRDPLAMNRWGHLEEMMLTLINLVQHQTYTLRQINNQKKEQVPEPIPGPRGKTPAKKRNDADNMARAQLAALKRARLEAQKGA